MSPLPDDAYVLNCNSVCYPQALALDTLNKRYTPLLFAAREKLVAQRAAERAELRRKLLGQ